MEKYEQLAKELTLALLYLTSFDEKIYGEKLTRSWKGYAFDVLDKLYDENYIFGSKKAKSVCLTEEGIKKAEELIEKYEKLIQGL